MKTKGAMHFSKCVTSEQSSENLLIHASFLILMGYSGCTLNGFVVYELVLKQTFIDG